jgi:hypothetical protein
MPDQRFQKLRLFGTFGPEYETNQLGINALRVLCATVVPLICFDLVGSFFIPIPVETQNLVHIAAVIICGISFIIYVLNSTKFFKRR